MSKKLYQEYISFLKKHGLYDNKCFSYIQSQAVLVDYQGLEDKNLIGCAINIDRSGRLRSFVPCLPYLNNKKMVAISIYVYTQALMLISKLGKEYEEDFYSRSLPLFYLKLYLVENANEVLWQYDQQIEKNLLENETNQSKLLLEYLERLLENYYQENSEAKKLGRKTKRLAKKCLFQKSTS